MIIYAIFGTCKHFSAGTYAGKSRIFHRAKRHIFLIRVSTEFHPRTPSSILSSIDPGLANHLNLKQNKKHEKIFG